MSEIICGYIYIMTSDAMPGLVYISRCGVLGAHEIDSEMLNVGSSDPRRWAGFPRPFSVELELRTNRSAADMQEIELELISYRVGRSPRFFRAPFAIAAETVLSVVTDGWGWRRDGEG